MTVRVQPIYELTPWLPAFPKERSTFARHNGEAAEFSTINCCLVDNRAALAADQAEITAA
jgi:hypothetical protein